MPGLIGIVEQSPGQHVQSIFERLLRPLQRGEPLRSEVHVSPQGQWALGRVHLGILQPDPQLIDHATVQALFHGDLDNEEDLRQRLETEGHPKPEPGIAALITALYRVYGPGFASRLHGTFCTAVLDAQTKRLILANDLLGSYGLYWFKGPQRFIFASELKAILGDPSLKLTLDPRAVADYLTFSFILGEKTLAAQVQLLPSASTLTYYWDEGRYTLERYGRIDAAFQPWEGTQAAYYAALQETFNGAVQRALKGGQAYGLSLSGGLDSRTILSTIDCSTTPISTYTLGVKGCADEVIAKKLAHLAGTKHQFFELDANYLDAFLPNLRIMIRLTDGMYLTHGLTEMLALQFLQQADFSILLRGHGGELAKTSLAWPWHTDARIYAMQSQEEFIPYMLERVNYVSRGVALHDLLSADWAAQVSGEARRSLEASLADVHLSPADSCSYLYLEHMHRRFTVPSLELFRNLMEVRMPFVDADFLAVLFRGPARWRDGTDIHRALIKANHARLLHVRNSNTGAPGNAGLFTEMLLDKFNTLFKRLNIYGYRHYHNFDLWMKQTLIRSVEDVLLDTESLSRGMYRQETLLRLTEETKRGINDHSYLLQILLILELWQRDSMQLV